MLPSPKEEPRYVADSIKSFGTKPNVNGQYPINTVLMSSAQFNIIRAIGISVSVDLRVSWRNRASIGMSYRIVVARNIIAAVYYDYTDARTLVWAGSGFIPIAGILNRVIPSWGGSLKQVYLYGGNSDSWTVYGAETQSQITPENSIVPAGAFQVQIQSNSVDTQPITISSGYIRMDVVYQR